MGEEERRAFDMLRVMTSLCKRRLKRETNNGSLQATKGIDLVPESIASRQGRMGTPSPVILALSSESPPHIASAERRHTESVIASTVSLFKEQGVIGMSV